MSSSSALRYLWENFFMSKNDDSIFRNSEVESADFYVLSIKNDVTTLVKYLNLKSLSELPDI